MKDVVRIAHFSDTHLGYRAGSRFDPETSRNQRSIDTDHAFTRTIDDIIARQPDGAIHSGDVFHHARPTWQSLRHFIRQMRRLEMAGIPTLVIAGNHDTPRIRTGGSAYSVLELALPGIRFVTDYADIHDVDTFGALDLHVHAIPHGALTNPDPVVASVLHGKRNVLVTHGAAPGVLPAGLFTEPGEQELGAHLLDRDFDYIALGHIHQAQQVTAEGWYAGSTERFGWNDLTAVPGYNVVSIAGPGESIDVTHVELPARPMIALKPVYGDGRQARDVANAVIEQLQEIDDHSAMTRVELRKIDRPQRREAQGLLKREAGAYTWSLEIAPERAGFVAEGGTEIADDTTLDLHALFTEFVASRTSIYPNEAFAAMLLDRGGRALTDAMLAESNPTPEDDAVS
jgi:DNA repair exonuclease SbcCD nuclease subunit